MRIATLEDDKAQSDAIGRLIAGAGHTCKCFETSRQFVTALRRETYDLLVMDWNLPESSGLEVLTWARENLATQAPVLLLTSRSSEADIVAGLGAGADDYVVKPVQPAVLLARINALLRRAYDRTSEGPETFGDYVFNPGTETLIVDEQTYTLTPKEFGLALLLFRNLHRALSRNYILENVWGRNPDLPSRTLDMHISRLRTKLNLRPSNGYRLTPVYSYGYRLERVDASELLNAPGAEPQGNAA
jgi:DNA-binding response OmpR family regulator